MHQGPAADDIAPFLPTSEEDAAFCSDVQLLWLNTLANTTAPVTKQDLVEARVRTMFAVVDREEVTGSWRRVLIKKVRKTTWQIIDEMGDSIISTVDANDDEGPIAEWDMYYRHPSALNFAEAKKAAKKRKERHDQTELDLQETQRRKKMRDNAVAAMQEGGRAMKQRATKVGGEIDEGTIVQVPLADVDTTKVDGKTLTLVVVEKVQHKHENVPKYRLACASGPLKHLYTRSKINPVKMGSRAALGLEEVCTTWRGKAALTEREAARSVSHVGGQGKKNKCGCKVGQCNTKRCPCFGADPPRLCGSHCHGGLNKNCKNCG